MIIAELPGVKKDQVHESVDQNILTIEGERPKRVPSRTVHVHQMEIPYGRFARRIQLPAETDVERIEAKFREGYLRIEVPRSGTRGPMITALRTSFSRAAHRRPLRFCPC